MKNLLVFICLVTYLFTVGYGYVLNEFKEQNILDRYNPRFVNEFRSRIVRPKYDVNCQKILEHDDVLIQYYIFRLTTVIIRINLKFKCFHNKK